VGDIKGKSRGSEAWQRASRKNGLANLTHLKTQHEI